MDYLCEAANSYHNSVNFIKNYGNLEFACVYCKSFYAVNDIKLLKSVNDTLLCNKCNIDAVVPITTTSKLFNLTNIEKINLINTWHYEVFEYDITKEDDESFNYEYVEIDNNLVET